MEFEPIQQSDCKLKIVAFDMDGTLLRGKTACELLADGIGRSEEMQAFERLSSRKDIATARAVMTEWYKLHQMADLIHHLALAKFAPGAHEGIALLRKSGIRVILVSISWQFAVESIAKHLGADEAIGTCWRVDGSIDHFWPEDKAQWLQRKMTTQGLSRNALAAVGDSTGDIPMLSLASTGFFVGNDMPAELPHIVHRPNAPIDEISRSLLGTVASKVD